MINDININDHNSTIDTTLNKLTESEPVILNRVASPFKNILFWPKLSEKKKKSKEKVSTIATAVCDEWLQYHLNKENEKAKKQQDIEERRKKREEIREKRKQERELKKMIKKEKIEKQKKSNSKKGKK